MTHTSQDLATLELMLSVTSPYLTEDERLPLERTHPLFTEGRANV